MRILIAEDDQVLADGLLRTLRASGAAVDHVASGTEADAALMTSSEFDLLILDLGLPKMHGLEVLRRLRGRGSAPGAAVPSPWPSSGASICDGPYSTAPWSTQRRRPNAPSAVASSSTAWIERLISSTTPRFLR